MSRAPVLPGVRLPTRRARIVPTATTLAGSALALLPVIADAPVLPPFGLLMVLGWRLLRPEMWQPWAAIPLGLADDLLTAQPIGSGMASWTIAFLLIDQCDHVLRFRDYWADWAIAAVAIALCLVCGTLAAGGGPAAVPAILPQIALTIACFPLIERLCAGLDRWRLAR